MSFAWPGLLVFSLVFGEALLSIELLQFFKVRPLVISGDLLHQVEDLCIDFGVSKPSCALFEQEAASILIDAVGHRSHCWVDLGATV